MTAHERAAWDAHQETVDPEQLNVVTIVEILFELAASNDNTLEAHTLLSYISDLAITDQEYIINQLAEGEVEFEPEDQAELSAPAPGTPMPEEALEFRRDHGSLDGVGLYLRSIGKVKLLTAEQEKDLGRKIQTGILAGELIQKYETGADVLEADLEALADNRFIPDILSSDNLKQTVLEGNRANDHMVEANLRLVVSIAKRYLHNGMTFLDLVQEGTFGLYKAAEKFDPALGYKFSTYATWWIRQAVRRGIADQAKLIRLPVQAIEKVDRITNIEQRLIKTFGRQPTRAELAAEAGIDEDKLANLLAAASTPVSLDRPIGEDEVTPMGSLIADPASPNPLRSLLDYEREEVIARCLNDLPERWRVIIVLRYGLDGGEPQTLEEIGNIFGITRERVRQLEVKALDKLAKLKETQGLR